MGHCQICEREIKSAKGQIAHHGYRRPHSGWQTASCMGARELPYELSRDAIPRALSHVEAFIQQRSNLLEQTKAGTVDIVRFGTWKNQPYHPGDSFYPVVQKEQIYSLEAEIRSATRDKDRLQKRYDNWEGPK